MTKNQNSLMFLLFTSPGLRAMQLRWSLQTAGKVAAYKTTDRKYTFFVYFCQHPGGRMTTSFQLLFTGPTILKPKPWELFLLFDEAAQGNNCLNETCFDDA